MVRWDSPLFTITWTDDELPMDRIWDAVTHGNVKPPNAGTQAVSGCALRRWRSGERYADAHAGRESANVCIASP